MTVKIDTKQFDKWFEDVKKAPIVGFVARRKLRKVMHKRGEEMVERAYDYVPVRTGYLKSTINYKVKRRDISLELRADAHYAKYVEYGTYKMEGRYFLTRAWNEVLPDLLVDFADVLTEWARE